VLEFWATWCPPCVEAIPSFKRLHGRFKDRRDFELVGVSLDGDVSVVRQFCSAHGMEWEQLVEPKRIWDNSVARTLDVKAVPLTCIIDKKGIIRTYNHFPGNLEPLVESLLSEPNLESSVERSRRRTLDVQAR
jgi:thiol-disulfide isomerase/thioredoxin